MRVNNSELKTIRALSVLVYLDITVNSLYKPYFLNDLRQSQSTGARVLIHTPGTHLDMLYGTDMGSRSATTIVLDQTKQVRLPSSYTHWTPQKTLGPVDESTPYTETYCFSVCIQQQLLRQCGCFSISYISHTAT